MSPDEVAAIRSYLQATGGPEIRDAHRFLKSGNVARMPLTTGDVLDIIPISQVQQNMQFPVEVAFAEPLILKGKPVVVTLKQIANLIRDAFFVLDRRGLFG